MFMAVVEEDFMEGTDRATPSGQQLKLHMLNTELASCFPHTSSFLLIIPIDAAARTQLKLVTLFLVGATSRKQDEIIKWTRQNNLQSRYSIPASQSYRFCVDAKKRRL